MNILKYKNQQKIATYSPAYIFYPITNLLILLQNCNILNHMLVHPIHKIN